VLNDTLFQKTFYKVYGDKKMAVYTLKSIGKNTDYMTVVREMDDGYVVRIVRDKDGYEDVTTDYLSKALFDTCLRTGYITKVQESNAVTA